MKRLSLTLCLIAALCMSALAAPRSPKPAGEAWVKENISKTRQPFSFCLDGTPSRQLLRNWKYSVRQLPPTPEGVHETVYSWKDPRSALVVECDVKTFSGSPAVEWLLRFRNEGKANSGQINQVKAADISLKALGEGPCEIYHALGSFCSKDDFKDITTTLAQGENLTLMPYAGRSSSDCLPYFNIRTGEGGMIFGIGWTGEWIAGIDRTANGFRVSTGMRSLDTHLYPSEQIRTPMTCIIPWQKDCDRADSQNLLRRHIMAYHHPKVGGKPAEAPLCTGFNFNDPSPCNVYTCLTTPYAKAAVSRYEAFGLLPDVFWLDAGWYEKSADWQHGYNWCNSTGNWDVDTVRFPGGLAEIGDAVHAAGSKFMVWFEPERVVKESKWAYEHPEYMLEAGGGEVIPHPIDLSFPDSFLLDLGNPEANRWMRENVARMIREGHIDYYRQDFNMEPEAFWYNNDAPGRLGMREIRYIEGLYEFWDYLMAEFPDLLIDNCASGGRRLDLEATGRSIPLWRTDFDAYQPDICQAQTYYLSNWLPIHGTAVLGDDDYSSRSSLSAAVIFNWKVSSPSYDVFRMQKNMAEFRKLHNLFAGDYYPLSGYGDMTADNIIMAYQLNRPKEGDGMAAAFRRRNASDSSAVLALRGLEEDSVYLLENMDTHERRQVSGKELMAGLSVNLPMPRSTALYYYQKKAAEPTQLTIFQLNLWQSLTSVPGAREALYEQLAALKPDVASFCELYEAGGSDGNGADAILDGAIDYLKKKTGVQYYKTYFTASGTRGVLSRYPVVESGPVKHLYRSGCQDWFYRTVIDLGGRQAAIYSSHSPYDHYGCYLPRGYGDGCAPYGWEKLPGGPITDVGLIQGREIEGDRDEIGRDLAADAAKQAAKGRVCIFAGDLNQPSHLDWTEATKDMFGHNGCAIEWSLSDCLERSGFKDAYRRIYPDPVSHPGFTWPVSNPAAGHNTNWTPDADERDRIDYVYYLDDGLIEPACCRMVGPEACICAGQAVKDGFAKPEEEIILPSGTWPSDHRGLLVTFNVY